MNADTNTNNKINTLTPEMMKKAGAVEAALFQAKSNRKPYSVLYNPNFDTYYVEEWYPGQFEAAGDNYFLTVSDLDASQIDNTTIDGMMSSAKLAIRIANLPSLFQVPTCIYYKGAHYTWQKVHKQMDEEIIAKVKQALDKKNENNLQCLFDVYVGAHAFVHGQEFVIERY